MKKILKKYELYIVIIVLIVVSIIYINRQNIMKPKYEELPEVKLKDVKSSKSFAIMIQENSEEEKYKNYEDNEWPGDNYKFKEAKCVDNNGVIIENAVSFEQKTKTVILKTDRTVYCTLYFNKSIIGKLRENDSNKVISDEEIGGMYRYQGVGVESAVDSSHKLVDNNYICFGTNDINKCNCNTEENCDKYMYRIIGVTNDSKLYLIKMTGIEEENNKAFIWNLKWLPSDCIDETCEWPNVDLYKRLNGTASNGNPVFTNNKRYDYMIEDNSWYSKIEKHNWMYGDVDYLISNSMLDDETIYGVRNNGLILYDIESGLKPTQHYELINGSWKLLKYQWNPEKYISAKIGLMYLHDYYLAYDNERDWYNQYDTNNWIFIDNNKNVSNIHNEWLLSSYGASYLGNYHAWYIKNNGTVDYEAYLDASGLPSLMIAVRPTFYLIDSIQIYGSGSLDNPYIINL